MTAAELIAALADGIAYAEGFFVAGSRPARNNNPGDLTRDLTGAGVGMDGPFIVYATPEDGWAALRAQVAKMLDGSSAFYNPGMSIAEIAYRYTATEPAAWAANVAARMGVTVETTLNSLLDFIPGGATGAGMGLAGIVIITGLIFFALKGGRA